MEVGDWLLSLDLAQYETVFREHDIDAEVLPELTEADLERLGVSLGHRKRLLKAIKALQTEAPASEPAAEPITSPALDPSHLAERRQLTVMFGDLVGSTALASRLDPEDLREVIGRYHARAVETIARFDGFVAKFMGDGVLAYFGYPHAHEDDAEQAVRAGLALIGAMGELGVPQRLQVRVGVATGLVVVGDLMGAGSAQEQAVVGETPNLAARLQALAEPDAVVISESTRRQIGSRFEVRDLGPQSFKGFAEPQRVWHVLAENRTLGRFEALRSGITPLVGRDEELELLLRRWVQAKAGEGSVVLLFGEPGIGKSRLAQTLLERIGEEPHTHLRYFCSPHHQDSALFPIVAQLERAAGFRREDVPEQRLKKMEALLGQATDNLGEVALLLLAELLSIPTGDRYPPVNFTPQKRKEETLRALLGQVEGLTERRPVLMLFEDAHWSDPTSIELLDLIVDRASALSLLLIITYRPSPAYGEFVPPWAGRSNVSLIGLNRLPPGQRAKMIAGVTSGKALPSEITEQITERTDGVPLFVEELTKAVLESGMLIDAGDHYATVGQTSLLAIPATLQASLLARLDRLAPARAVAQIGAALGRQFSHELISAVAPIPQRQLDESLVQLVSAELVYRRGLPPDAEYTFKHALIQDAAYSTLLRSRRLQLHAQIATVIEARFPEIVATQPERLAHHFDVAGLTDPATNYYRLAANRAIAASANAEALVHLRRGLELIGALPASAERSSRELDFRLALGPPLIATQGWGSGEAEANYVRAKILGSEIGESVELFRSLVGLWVYEQCRPDRPDAQRPLAVSRELLTLAAKLGGDDLSLLAEYSGFVSCHWAADYVRTLSHAGRVLKIYDPARHSGPKAFMVDPAMVAMSFESMTLWYLGYPDRAHQRALAALSMDRVVSHPFSLCWVLWQEVCLRILRREPKLIAARAEAHSALVRDQGFALDQAVASMFKIWREAQATARLGDDRSEAFRSAQAEAMKRGFSPGAPIFSTLFAQCLSKQGEVHEALAELQTAIVQIDKTGYCIWEPEVYRVMGDLSLQQSSSASVQAEGFYRRSIERARSQQAKSWELRTAMSYARLMRDQGRAKEAYDLLAPIYAWFTEGFGTKDLKDAKALLEELAADHGAAPLPATGSS